MNAKDLRIVFMGKMCIRDRFTSSQTKNISELQHDIDSLEIKVNAATTSSYEPLLKDVYKRQLPRLGHEVGDGHVAARTAGVVDRAVGTAVVAPVLHLEEGARAVAARKGREERRERIGFAAVHLRPALARQFNHLSLIHI